MKEFTYEVAEDLALISTSPANGWQRRLRRVSWNGGPAKLDLRGWSPDGKRMGKGMTFTDAEAAAFRDALRALVPTLEE